MRKTTETTKNKGITLIALIIMIIVLLILAGVSIAVITGNNGILTQANKAKNDNNIAGIKEKVQVEALGSIDKSGEFDKDAFMNNLKNNLTLTDSDIIENTDGTIIVEIDGYEVKVNVMTGEVENISKENKILSASVKPGIVVSKTEKNNYSDGTNTATVPQGFTVSGKEDEQKIANGLVIYDIPESEISNIDWNTAAAKYNQFVWIPVTNSNVYQRELSYPSTYGSNSDTTPANSTFTDTGYLPIDIQPTTDDATNNEKAERNAVLKYNGFYIARYEAGNENLNVVSKQKATVYVHETQESFKSIGKTMYGDSRVHTKSAMCSGIQWDIVMKFVDGKKDGNREIYDVRKYSSARHKGGSVGIEKSGNNIADKVQNIYDLEGNCVEYIAERNNTSSTAITRGGCCYENSNDRASRRSSFRGNAYSDRTFRPVLYIK